MNLEAFLSAWTIMSGTVDSQVAAEVLGIKGLGSRFTRLHLSIHKPKIEQWWRPSPFQGKGA